MSNDIQTTILDLPIYIKVKRKNVTHFLYVTMDTRSIEIKRMMTQFFSDKKIHDMELHIPRFDNRKFADPLTLEMMGLKNGETLTLHLRKDGDKYEDISEVTGNYDKIQDALYR
jgi:hypothetical protein